MLKLPKPLKIIIGALLATVMLVLAVGFFLANISILRIPSSIDYKVDEIRAMWERDNGPVVNGIDIDYSYYSPVEHGAPADEKYPVVVVMAGALEGLQEGLDLVANMLASWSAPEYQERFENGGAYIYIARAPEEDWLYWDSPKLTPSLKASIDDFCKKHPSIDTEQIHVIGWCLGGDGAINLSTSYPNDFATTMIMCPSRGLNQSEAEALKNMPVWFMGSETDSYSSYEKCILDSYKLLVSVSNRKEDIRLTSCSSAPDVPLLGDKPFLYNHNLWANLSVDMETTDPEYTDLKTVDGNGKEVENLSAIGWVSSHNIADGREASSERETSSEEYKRFNAWWNFRLSFKSGLMRLMLNSFEILGWI